MSFRRLLTTVAAALLTGIAFAVPAAADASIRSTAAITGMTSGRLGPTLTALVGLIGVISGGLALTRSGGRPAAAVVASVAGSISVVLGGLFAATADGGPGTGNGILGAAIAVVLGLIATILGGCALARARRAG